MVGETGNAKGIWLAIDNDGNAFMMDIGTDFLYSVDLETGEGTVIGSTGLELSFAQDAGFDRTNGVLYAASYYGGGTNRLYSVDTSTGAFTELGSVNSDCAQVGLVAVLGETLGVSDNSIEGFSFYPNPLSEKLNLKSINNNIDSVSIYSLLGQEIVNTKIHAEKYQLDVSSLSTGTYIMEVDVNGKTGAYKLIKN